MKIWAFILAGLLTVSLWYNYTIKNDYDRLYQHAKFYYEQLQSCIEESKK